MVRRQPARFPLHLHPPGQHRRADGRPRPTRARSWTCGRRARSHTLAADSAVSFGWTGTEAWQSPPGAELPTKARFWSLTPYYFIGIPFVLADPGVRTAVAPPDTVEGAPVDVGPRHVRARHRRQRRTTTTTSCSTLKRVVVRGVRYVVSHPGVMPDGGTTPETLMLYDGAQTVEGAVGAITLQTGFRSFLSADGTSKAQGTLTEVRFAPDTSPSAFDVPAGAEVLEGV